MLDPTTLGDFGLSWLEASGPNADIVLSTRVRLARNLQGHAFEPRLEEGERRAIFERVCEVARKGTALADGAVIELSTVS
ncbi:MAG: hypothetical protein P8174_08310 [Gemmatimonadota bacterium]